MPERSFQVDDKEYPFKPHWLESGGSHMHYVDEGKGQPVLLLHGNPTWSYLYRDVIKGVVPKCRAIAPDYPGFGFSDHPPGYGYMPQDHAAWVNALIDKLKLKNIILVVQDWGGPIGMSIATERPELIAGLVICNTWAWPPDMAASMFASVAGGALGTYLHKQHNFFARVLVPLAIDSQKTDTNMKAYTDPFPTPESREGTWTFPKAITAAKDWLLEIEDKLGLLKAKPTEMVWAMKDPAFGREAYIRRWKSFFPSANLQRVKNANHYLQEDCPELIAEAVLRLAGKTA